MIGRGHNHRVDVLLLVQHDAEIFVLLGPRVLGKDLLGPRGVHVAEGHDVLAFAGGQIALAHAGDAHAGEVELFARRRIAWSAQHVPRHNHGPCGGCRAAQESPACNRLARLPLGTSLGFHDILLVCGDGVLWSGTLWRALGGGRFRALPTAARSGCPTIGSYILAELRPRTPNFSILIVAGPAVNVLNLPSDLPISRRLLYGV